MSESGPSNTPPKAASEKKPTVRPRDAASLIIFDRNGPELRFLLGRRASRSKFMPDVYVFPGGAVDAQDAKVKPASALPDGMQVHMGVADKMNRAQTLAITAVRETFEETGILVASHGPNCELGSSPSWAPFRDADLGPALENFHYVGRAITPTSRPIRFHARFFALDKQHIAGNVQDSNELLDVGWFTSAQLAEKSLRRVTQFMIDQVVTFVKQGKDNGTYVGGAYFTQRNGKLFVRDDAG